MKQSLSSLLALLALAAVVAAQAPLPRGPLHDTRAARKAITDRLPLIAERDLLLITVDALMLEQLPIFGGENREPLPAIEILFNESITFTQARSTSPHRSSALVSVHLSQYPSTVLGIGSTAKTPSLVSRLADVGFKCWSVVRRNVIVNDSEFLGEVSPSLDIDRRDWTHSIRTESMLKQLGNRVVRRRSGERLFGWLHLQWPYPPASYHPGFDLGGRADDHYRASLRFLDSFLGELAGKLLELDLADTTNVVLVGVHGLEEPTFNRNMRHNALGDETLRVPVVMQIPGLEKRRIAAPIETIDVAPTILELAGVDVPYSFQGRSLVDLLVDPNARKDAITPLFADRLAWSDESEGERRHAVMLGKYRLSRALDGQDERLYEDGELVVDAVVSKPDALADLREHLTEHEIYSAACIQAWSRGVEKPIDPQGPLGRLGRARFLAERGDPRASVLLDALLRERGDHVAEAIAVGIDNGLDPKPMPLDELLTSRDETVRGLAGAWLAMHGDQEKGLDAALAALRTSRSPVLTKALIEALSRSGSDRARGAIAALEVYEDDLAARRDLALVRLGDEKALERLPQRFLAPEPPYDRLPFLRAIAEHMPDRLVGIGRIYLEDGDGDPGIVRAVMSELESRRAHEAATSVAGALLTSSDPELRAELLKTLERWGSFEGAHAAMRLAARSALDAAFSARLLMRLPGVLSSPFLPSMRMDHLAATYDDPKRRQLENASDLTGQRIEFTLELDGVREGRCALLFEASSEEPLDSSSLHFEIQFNESRAWMSTEEVTLSDGLWCWVGPLRPESLEPGVNLVQIRLRRKDRAPLKAHARAFMIFPDEPRDRFMVAGIDLAPMAGDPVMRSTGRPVFDSDHYELFARCDHLGADYGEIRILVDGRIAERLPAREFRTPRSVKIELPAWTKPTSTIELLTVEVPVEGGLSAILYGVGRRR